MKGSFMKIMQTDKRREEEEEKEEGVFTVSCNRMKDQEDQVVQQHKDELKGKSFRGVS